MTETEYRFDTADVRDVLGRPDGDLDDGIDAFVSIRLVSNTELVIELTSTEDNTNDRVTEKFYVPIFRGEPADGETMKKMRTVYDNGGKIQ